MSKFSARQVVSDDRAATTSLFIRKVKNWKPWKRRWEFLYRIYRRRFKAAIKKIWVFVFFCHARRWTTCVRQKFESVYLHVIKKHRNNLLFSYYELGFRCFELNLFSHCFDSVRLEKFKPEQALRTLDWKDSLFTRNSLGVTKCLKFMLFMLPDQTAAS